MNNKKQTIKALGFFVVILTLAFGSVTWFTSVALATAHSEEQIQIDEDEWTLLRNSLSLYLAQAKYQGNAKVDHITVTLNNKYTLDEIAALLDTYEEPNNVIRNLVTEAVSDLYFNNIESDNTDGFVVKDFTVSTDSSENCVSFGSERSFDLEMLMHANPALALEAFTRIATGDVDNYKTGAVDRPIFFQFDTNEDGIDMQKNVINIPPEHQGKKGLELSSYDIHGLKEYFMKTKSWESTFQAFEFVTPSYIFNQTDLALRPYIERGKRTNITKLSLNVVFNYKTVIDHNPILKRDLYKFSQRRAKTKSNFLVRESILYLVVILLAIICFIAMHYTNKLVEEVDGAK